MERHTLRVVIVLGVLVTLLGGTGIFAVFTDRATAGQNDVTSGARQSAANLQIAPGVYDPTLDALDCASPATSQHAFSDDTTTGQFVASHIQPAETLGPSFVCLYTRGPVRLP